MEILAVDAKVTLVHGPLAGWMKVSFEASDGTIVLGWVRGDCLQAAQSESIKLYDEPLGAAQEIVGAIIDIRIRLPGWNKVDVVLEDGTARAGWVQVAPQPAGGGTTRGRGRKASDKPQLVLGPNAVYQDHLMTASARSGLDAAALAALINAEAAKLAGGLWNANSKAPSSTAAGLTQFLADTWKGEARRPNTLLNERARSLGLVDDANAVVAGQEQRLLNLRFDPELSIVAAAEYGRANLDALVAAGLVEDGLGDDERARFIYLAHHEGLAGAKAFLTNRASYSYSDVVRQVGKDKAKVIVDKAGGDTTAAYRSWLEAYMDEKIRPSDFRTGAPGGGGGPGSGMPALKSFAGPTVPLAELSQRTALAKAIQWRLTELGYLDPPADGRFGPVSTWALGAFCELNGLSMGDGFSTAIASPLLAPRRLLPALTKSGTWFDKVVAAMQQKAYFINRHPDCLNIVYLEGVNPDGTLNDDAPDVFNDVRIVFGVDAQGKPRIDGIWDGTTEPGRVWTENPMNPKGAARIAFNQYKAWVVGTHHAGTGSAHEALVQVEPVSVYRDLNRDYKRTGDVLDTGLFGINQHWGYDQPSGSLGRTSAGCLVGRTRAGHREFMRLIKRDPRYAANGGYRFMTAIMAGDEVLA
ncbi:peptidoglycan-binding domain-containing protein [uncultured Alsobacter sp.]|uniref:peptidoglycan-binding domain-containing protein n=1 Tax=uncultured Alsobacter sp. TaxID=1748258 RepID=UPI002600C1A5|nr:peptidoglycan-binding domain-containing protein [uncultured Alsobacter sp.]